MYTSADATDGRSACNRALRMCASAKLNVRSSSRTYPPAALRAAGARSAKRAMIKTTMNAPSTSGTAGTVHVAVRNDQTAESTLLLVSKNASTLGKSQPKKFSPAAATQAPAKDHRNPLKPEGCESLMLACVQFFRA